jgi:hypothetical protein
VEMCPIRSVKALVSMTHRCASAARPVDRAQGCLSGGDTWMCDMMSKKAKTGVVEMAGGRKHVASCRVIDDQDGDIL